MLTRSRWPVLALLLLVSLALPVANVRLLEHVATEHAPGIDDQGPHPQALEHGHDHHHGHEHPHAAGDPRPDAPAPGEHAHRLAPDTTAARAQVTSLVAPLCVIVRGSGFALDMVTSASSWPAPSTLEPPRTDHGRRSILLL